MAVAIFVGYGVFAAWPARPRTWIGWAIAMLWGGTLLLLGEQIGKFVHGRAPADPGRLISLKRIGLALGALGDPLGALGKMIAPHYHETPRVPRAGARVIDQTGQR